MAEGLLAGKMRGGLMQNHRVLLEDYHDGSRKKYVCVRLRSQAVFFKGLTEQGRVGSAHGFFLSDLYKASTSITCRAVADFFNLLTWFADIYVWLFSQRAKS